MCTWVLAGIFFLATFCCCTDWNQSCLEYLLKGLMWNFLILFFVEGYLELILGVFIDWFYFDL